MDNPRYCLRVNYILPRRVSFLSFHLLMILWICNTIGFYSDVMSLMQSVSVQILNHMTLTIPVSKQQLLYLEHQSPYSFIILVPNFSCFDAQVHILAQKRQLLQRVLPSQSLSPPPAAAEKVRHFNSTPKRTTRHSGGPQAKQQKTTDATYEHLLIVDIERGELQKDKLAIQIEQLKAEREQIESRKTLENEILQLKKELLLLKKEKVIMQISAMGNASNDGIVYQLK